MKIKIMKTLLSVAVLSAMSNATWAAGTAANTDINNRATITYSVGGATQTPINSSAAGNSDPSACTAATGVGACFTTFKVDKKVDLTVTGASDVNVIPNTTGGIGPDINVLQFTVENTGNSAENFTFSLDSTVGGDFDATGCTATPASISPLAVDTPTIVKVDCDIPNTGTTDNGGTAGAGVVADTKESVIDLLATVTGVSETPDGTPDSASTVDTVFADGTGTATDGASRNAKHSATGKYIVNTANVTVQKTSAVVSMVVNGNTINAAAGAKRIPGAIVEYTITVSNAGTANADASGIVISDSLPANLAYKSCSFSGVGITGCSGPAVDATSGTIKSTPDPAGFTLTAGDSAVLKFQAEVQ